MTAAVLRKQIDARADDGMFVTLKIGHPINYSRENAHGKWIHKLTAIVAGVAQPGIMAPTITVYHTTVTEVNEAPLWL